MWKDVLLSSAKKRINYVMFMNDLPQLKRLNIMHKNNKQFLCNYNFGPKA